MCGIWAIFGSHYGMLQHFIPAYSKIHHRGPDAWRIENDHRFENCCLGFHRLAIVDDHYGMQPMRLKGLNDYWLICNGELYNYNRLGDEFGFKYETQCDVEVILHLFARGGIEQTPNQLDGVFAFCLLDAEKRLVYLARDTYGVRPLFKLTDDNGFLAVCSEAKGLIHLTESLSGKWKIEPFPPGHFEVYRVHDNGTATFIKREAFHTIGNNPAYRTLVPYTSLSQTDVSANIRQLFSAAVSKRLMSHRRIGCMLSGGLDSSLVAALLVKAAKEAGIQYPIQTFATGMANSPDILAARKVAKFIGSEHHEVLFTPEDVYNVLDNVIYHLETYDITTIRASIGMYIVSQYIKKNTDTTVVFSGEGSDELTQGYIYFKDAPDGKAAHEDSIRLLKELYLFDNLRADRTTAAHGLELRVPFLDHQFTGYYLSLPLEIRRPKNGVEKYLLRSAFEGTGLLPEDILWRPKEAFSDGVATVQKSLFNYLQDYIEDKISDKQLATAVEDYPHVSPTSKESYYYRQKFLETFPGQDHFVTHYWLPKWREGVTDPSARMIPHYNSAPNNNEQDS